MGDIGECRSWIWSTLTAQLRMMSLWWGRDTLGRGQRAQVSPLKQGLGKHRGAGMRVCCPNTSLGSSPPSTTTHNRLSWNSERAVPAAARSRRGHYPLSSINQRQTCIQGPWSYRGEQSNATVCHAKPWSTPGCCGEVNLSKKSWTVVF